jgi:5'-3' exoribonuclease 1
MGIPYYFSDIIKKYPKIFRKLNKHNVCDFFYIDSNSIVYDVAKTVDLSNTNSTDEIERLIIKNTCEKIQSYIETISPTKIAYIAFDGVPPFAKIEQQRSRRHKSYYQTQYLDKIMPSNANKWSTVNITPGTEFMRKLNQYVRTYFLNTSNRASVLFSGSDEPGEGEHKLFQFIRENAKEQANKNIVIYGLDADLIMLCLNHLHISKNIFLFRETPDFANAIQCELDSEEEYLLNINELADGIICDMTNDDLTIQERTNIITDYILICFFLGNDFLPHFPALNIRTNGMPTLIETYKKCILDKHVRLTKDGVIQWSILETFIKSLAEQEETLIKAEYERREKLEKRGKSNDPAKAFELLPTYDRKVEKYINVNADKWSQRYYISLFDLEIGEERRRQICVNYLEGLEWTLAYYNNKCLDWRWCYKYNYPPLLTDLFRYVPFFNKTFFEVGDKSLLTDIPVNEVALLAYVLPKYNQHLLPSAFKNRLLDEWFDDEYVFEWAFCKYFWECHPKLKELKIEKLEQLAISL